LNKQMQNMTQSASSLTDRQREKDDVCDSIHSKQSSAVVATKRIIPQVDLQLQNVTYAPYTSIATGRKTERKRRVILSKISTKISPNTLNAWMGPSGSGKTSLMSVAAGLISQNDMLKESLITVNGEEGRIPKRLVGVVWQDDLLLSNLTVEETIYFSARLKSPSTIPNNEIHQVVEETMQDLGLLHIRHSLIGSALGASNPKRGVSGGERKRTAVASELVIRPSVIFLDEPTSGLDATSAQALMKTLKDLAGMGHSIAVVIHQPRTEIFKNFDNLLLLSKGEMIFNGPASDARAFLELCPAIAPLPPETGIADWIMDVISADEASNAPQLPSHWEESAEKNQADLTANAHNEENPASRRLSLSDLKLMPKFETNGWVQFKLLLMRTIKQQRGERLTVATGILTLAYTFFTSLLWWRLPYDTNHIYERTSLFFFIIITQSNQIVTASVQTFSRERALVTRERAKKMYRVSLFFISKTLSDLSSNVLLPCLYGTAAYWLGNLRPTAAAFFKFLVSYYLTLSTAQSMGLFLSIAIPNTRIALILAPGITLFFMILGGYYVPYANMHAGILWVTWTSFARYGYTSLVINEFDDREIPCSQDELSISFGCDATCPFPGNEVLTSIGVDGVASEYWFNIVMLMVLQVFFRFAAYFLLRRSK